MAEFWQQSTQLITGDDSFRINDIELSIPPTKISIAKSTQDFRWDMVRSEGPIYIRSGRGVVTMNLSIDFVGRSEFDVLQRLLAEIQLSPIVHIENEHVRANMSEVIAESMQMAWAVRNITVMQQDPDHWVVSMILDWFNYAPFINDFVFLKKIPGKGENIEKTFNLKESEPWQEWVNDYIVRGKFKPYSRVTNDEYDLAFVGIEMTMVPDSKSNQAIENPTLPEGIKSYRQYSIDSSDQEIEDLHSIGTNITEEEQEEDLRNVWDALDPDGQSIMPTDNPYDATIDDAAVVDIVARAHRGEVRDSNEILEALKNGGWKKLENSPPFLFGVKGRDAFRFMWRPLVLKISRPSVEITTIAVSVTNHYARLPIVGYNYATIQMMGGLDRTVQISMMVNGIKTLKQIQGYWEKLQQQVLKLREYTRNNVVLVENNLLNGLGVDSLIPQAIEHSTIEGQPGTYMVTMMFAVPPDRVVSEELELYKSTSWSDERLYDEFIEMLVSNNFLGFDVKSARFGVPLVTVGLSLSNNKGGKGLIFADILQDKLIDGLNEAFKKIVGYNPTTVAKEASMLASPGALGAGSMKAAALVVKKKRDYSMNPEGKNKMNVIDIVFYNPYLFDEVPGGKHLKELVQEELRKARTVDQDTINPLSEDEAKEEIKKNPYLEEAKIVIAEAVRSTLLTAIGVLGEDYPYIKKFADQLKEQDGQIKGSGAYPDLNLDAIAKKYGIEYLNPDFYFFPEGYVRMDMSAMAALVGEAQQFVNKQWKWLLSDSPGSMISWVKDEYLKKHLTSDQREKFNNNMNKLRQQWQVIGEKLSSKKKQDIKIESSTGYFEMGVFDGLGTRSNATTNKKEGIPIEVKTPNGLQKIVQKANDIVKELFGDVATQMLTLENVQRPYVPWYHEHSYNEEMQKSADNYAIKKEEFHLPLGPQIIKTSPWGEYRERTYRKKQGHRTKITHRAYFHTGQDFGSSNSTPFAGTDATAYAIYDGTVVGVKNTWEPRSAMIVIDHYDIGLRTVYEHMDREQIYVRTGQHVKKGQELGKIYPHADKASFSKHNYGHLHFECHALNMAKLTKALGVAEIPKDHSGAMWDRSAEPTNIDPNFVLYRPVTKEEFRDVSEEGVFAGRGMLEHAANALQESIIENNSLRMLRAYPTFKIFFIEEDSIDGDGRRLTQFDDLFGYSGVHSITIEKSEDNPVDTATIIFSNVSGNLTNRRFGHDTSHAYDKNGKVVTEDTSDPFNQEKENPIKSFFLQEGLKVLIRMGYGADPNDLKDVLIGTVAGVEFNETSDIITVVVQSYGYELVQRVKGTNGAIEKSSGYLRLFESGDTQVLLSDLLYNEEVKHFGRWELGDYNLLRSALTDRWKVIPNPVDDNIFAPDSSNIDGGAGWIFESQRYFLFRTTIWDVFQEMTFRHPECIARPVPYWGKRGPRMTMFFGVPSQVYFSRDLTPMEEAQLLAKSRANTLPTEDIQTVADDPDTIADSWHNDAEESYSSYSGQTVQVGFLKNWLLAKGKEFGIIRPFRNYHVATSWTNIIANNIKATPDGVYNAVKVQYSEVDSWTSTDQPDFDDHLWDSGEIEVQAHWTIPDHLVREIYVPRDKIYNCETYDLAQRYALKFLKDGLGKAYKGELIILGNPSIKPNDIIYIIDTYSDIVGPIEVRAVTHEFSKDMGFVTVIKPKMCVAINEWASMSVSDALGYILQHITGIGFAPTHDDTSFSTEAHNSTIAIGAGTTMAAIGAGVLFYGGAPIIATTALAGYGLFLLGGRKFTGWTQFGNPVLITPLLLHGRELTAGTGFRYTKNGWWSKKAGQAWKWFQDGMEGIKEIMTDWADKWEYAWRNPPLPTNGSWFGTIRGLE